MDCRQIQDLFTDRLDGTLAERSSLFDMHLSACPSCSEEWRAFQHTVTFVRESLPVEAPFDLLSGVTAKLERPAPLKRLLRFLRETDFSIPLPAAAAIVVVALAGGFFIKSGQIDLLHTPPADSTVQQSRMLGDVEHPAHAPVPSPRYTATRGTSPYSSSMPGMGLRFTAPLVHNMPQHSAPGNTNAGSDETGASFSAPPQAANHSSPDLTISVKNITKTDRVRLLHALMAGTSWQVHRHKTGGLLVKVRPQELPSLYHLLANRNAHIAPHGAAMLAFGSEKNVLTVALFME